MKKIFILAIAMLCCALMVYAQTEMPRFEIPTTRANGMGGSHIAYTDDVYSLLINPAAMIRTQQRSFFSLSASLFSPEMTIDLVDSIREIVQAEGDSTLGPLGNMVNKLGGQGTFGLGFDIREFPLSIAWVANGFGFGIWSRVFVNPNINGTNIQVNLIGDVIVPVGFAFKVMDMGGHTIDFGLTLKGYGRAMLEGASMNILKMTEMDVDNPLDSFSAPLIVGAGLDAGLLYRGAGLLKGFSAGVTFTDIFNHGTPILDFMSDSEPAGSYTVPFAINLGAAYELKIFNLLGVVVAADLRDITTTDYTKRNPVLNIGLGAQVSLLNMFKFRAGMSDALLSVGVGVDLGIFELSFAYYGKELGLEPGLNPVAVMDLTIAFRPEAKKRLWPWAQRPIFGG